MLAWSCFAFICLVSSDLAGKTKAGLFLTLLFAVASQLYIIRSCVSYPEIYDCGTKYSSNSTFPSTHLILRMAFTAAFPIPPLGKIPSVVKEESEVR